MNGFAVLAAFGRPYQEYLHRYTLPNSNLSILFSIKVFCRNIVERICKIEHICLLYVFIKNIQPFSRFQTMQFPLIIDSITPEKLESYRIRIQHELPDYSADNPEYEIVYQLRDDTPADYTRAIQEREILNTRIKLYNIKTGRTTTLRSFVEIWEDPHSGLAADILRAKDPNEAKWQLTRKYNYKIATTFMPMYAKSIYEYFGVANVLDPCAGWGDRMVGALSSKCVQRYVAFDPNIRLVEGYKKMQADFGNYVSKEDGRYIEFSNQYSIYSEPFETGVQRLNGEQFQFAFTSPPFFDYEEYSPDNPTYRNWYSEFYEPLFVLVHAHLVDDAFFAIHIDDTSAGKIRDFLFNRVGQITSFKYRGKIGLVGGKSGKIRNVYLFQKQ
jgi:hypothetical protein